MGNQTAVEVDGLAKTYSGGIEALKPMTLSIPRGVCFGLLGPNGAGKSTLVKTLLGIVRPSRGQARLLGRDFRSPEARRGVGFLPEGHRFPRYLTGRGVCHYFGKLSGLSGAKLKDDTERMLRRVGMSEWADTKIGKYSKGMNQRVGLAQALLGSPPLVFLDEPTDGVDPVGRRELRDVIREAAGDGTTIFLNSHLLSEVEVTCDRIAVMSKGRLLRTGSVAEIKRAAQQQGPASLLVTFETGALPEGFWGTLEQRGATRTAEGFSVTLQERAEVSPLIDLCRARGVEIHAVRPQDINLEDAFINLIGLDGDVGGER